MSHPITTRPMQTFAFFSLRRCLWVAFGLGLLGLAASVWSFFQGAGYISQPELLVVAVAILLLLFTPVFVAFLAAVMAGRSASGAAVLPLAPTSATNRRIVQDQVVAALYRVRGLFIFVVALTPALVILLMKLLLDVAVIFRNILTVAPGEEGLYGAPTIAPLPTTWDALTLLLLAMGLWGFNWLAAALGVALGLWRGSGKLAAIIAPLALVALLAGTLIVSLAFFPGQTAGMLVAALPAWLSYPAAFGLMRLAERWARPDAIGSVSRL